MKGAGVRAGGMHTVRDANANMPTVNFPCGARNWGPAVGRLQVLVSYFLTVMCPSEEWEALGC
jgi:hypothetical protein